MKFLLLCFVLALQAQPPPTSTDLVNQLQAILDQLRTSVAVPVISKTVIVKVGASIQAAIDAAPDHTEISIVPGNYAVNLILRAGKTGIVIRSGVSLPAQTLPWVTPELVGGKLATLTPLDPSLPIIRTEAGAHDYLLQLLEIGPNLALPDRTLLYLGDFTQTTLAQVPNHIDVDRCYIHGSDVSGGLRGISLNTRNSTISGSYISNFRYPFADSQAIGIFNGPGPFAIVNNYLEASGENLMAGGQDPTNAAMTPSDIVIRGNYFYKPLAWKLARNNVKNLIEFKNAQRVLVDANVFENVWADGQAGSAAVVTVRNQDNTCPFCTVRDVIFQNNVFKNAQGFTFNVLGLDNLHPTVQAVNLTITNNLAIGMGGGVQMDHGFVPTTITHNTTTGNRGTFLFIEGPPLPAGSFTYTDNVTAGGIYGLGSSGLLGGTPTLTQQTPGFVFHHNVIEGNIERVISYPPGNYSIAAGSLAGKLDPTWHYTGTEVSSDGKPLGADVDAIKAAIPWLTLP